MREALAYFFFLATFFFAAFFATFFLAAFFAFAIVFNFCLFNDYSNLINKKRLQQQLGFFFAQLIVDFLRPYFSDLS